MAELWIAFIEDYKDQYVYAWSLEFTLEAFWHYCQDGKKECDAFLERRREDKCAVMLKTGNLSSPQCMRHT